MTYLENLKIEKLESKIKEELKDLIKEENKLLKNKIIFENRLEEILYLLESNEIKKLKDMLRKLILKIFLTFFIIVTPLVYSISFIRDYFLIFLFVEISVILLFVLLGDFLLIDKFVIKYYKDLALEIDSNILNLEGYLIEIRSKKIKVENNIRNKYSRSLNF